MKGRISVTSSYTDDETGRWGVAEVDLGGLVETTRHSSIHVDARTRRLVGRKLEWAGTISTGDRFTGRVELPVLRYVWYAGFAIPHQNPKLELPALEETLKMGIKISHPAFTIRLPRLAKGRVTVSTYGLDPDTEFQGSLFEAPLLPPENIGVEGHPRVVRRLRTLLSG